MSPVLGGGGGGGGGVDVRLKKKKKIINITSDHCFHCGDDGKHYVKALW